MRFGVCQSAISDTSEVRQSAIDDTSEVAQSAIDYIIWDLKSRFDLFLGGFWCFWGMSSGYGDPLNLGWLVFVGGVGDNNCGCALADLLE